MLLLLLTCRVHAGPRAPPRRRARSCQLATSSGKRTPQAVGNMPPLSRTHTSTCTPNPAPSSTSTPTQFPVRSTKALAGSAAQNASLLSRHHHAEACAYVCCVLGRADTPHPAPPFVACEHQKGLGRKGAFSTEHLTQLTQPQPIQATHYGTISTMLCSKASCTEAWSASSRRVNPQPLARLKLAPLSCVGPETAYRWAIHPTQRSPISLGALRSW
jgi:hypothetical protein